MQEKRNIINWYSLVEVGAAPLLILLTTPFLLLKLGNLEYSKLVTLQALAALGGIGSLGISNLTIRSVSEKSLGLMDECKKEARAICEILNFVLLAVFLIAMAIVGLRALVDSANIRSIASWQIVLAVVLFTGQQYDQLMSGCLKALGQFRAAAVGEMSGRFMAYVAVAALSAIHAPILLVCIVFVLGSISSALFKFIALAANYGGGWLTSDLNVTRRKDILKFSLWSWIQNVTALASGSIDRLIVGAHSGASVLATYGAVLQIAQVIHTSAAAILQPTIMIVSHSAKVDDGPRIRNVIRRCLKLNINAVAISTFAILIYAYAYRARLTGSVESSFSNVVFLVLTTSVLALNVSAYYCLIGLGKIKQAAIINALASLTFLLILIIAAPVTIEGIAAARAVYSFGALLVVIPLVKYYE